MVTYYTDDDLYRNHYREMSESLSRHAPHLNIHSEFVPSGDWAAVCSRKGEFCRRMLSLYRERIVWLDVDARVLAPLSGLERRPSDFDIGCHYSTLWRGKRELLSGTLLFEPTERAMALCADWGARCWKEPRKWDQKHLQDAVDAAPGLKVWDFGVKYVFIHDHHRRQFPDAQPVIEHLQASREARRRQRSLGQGR